MHSATDFSTDELRELCIASLQSSKANNIVTIDLNHNSSIADEMIVASGTSNRHVCAVADRLVEYMAKHDIHGLQVSGADEGKWVIVDLGIIMVHILQEVERERYQLENLYKCIAAGKTE